MSGSTSDPPGININPLEQPVIIQKLFEHLPFRDLLSSSQVCKKWSEIGSLNRRRRRESGLGGGPRPKLFVCQPYPLEEISFVLEWYNNAIRRVSGLPVTSECKAWSMAESTVPKPQATGTKLTLSYGTINSKLMETVEGSYWEPEILLCYCTDITLAETGLDFLSPAKNHSLFSRLGSSSDEDEDLNDYTLFPPWFKDVAKIIPAIGFLHTAGGIFTVPGENSLSFGPSYEIENSKYPLVAGMLIPKLPGVKFHWSDYSKILNSGEIGAYPEEVKGIIVFQSHGSPLLVSPILLKFLQTHPRVPMAGGLVQKVVPGWSQVGARGSHLAKQTREISLIITGETTLKVGSVILKDPNMTEQNLKELSRFKDAGMDGEDKVTYAFMFACCGRGRRMHRKNHVESQLFRSIYPKTPLLGSFTDGELFHGYVPGQETVSRLGKFKYEYCTVFIFISYSRA